MTSNIMKNLWYFIIFGLANVYSRDIYTSINWDPRNPIFQADGKKCGPGPRQLKEHAAGMNDRTFVGGRTYYLIATSDGTQSSVNDLSGGHCNDTSKNVHMKIEVYVCNKSGDRICNSRNVGILTCPPPGTTAPYTSPHTTTLTHGTELGINITESVVTDKSETVRKLPRTESKITGTIITGEKTTETARPGSTKNEAKRGKRIAENEMRKTDGKNCGPGPRQLKVRLNSQIYLVCPNVPTVLQQRGHDVQTSNMKENIWLLHNKTAFDECDVSQVQFTQDTDRFICNDPTSLVFLSLPFLEHAAVMNDRTFVGGRTYYLIATSHGTQSSVNDLSGGHCNDTSKNVHMKIEVYVCNKTGDRICNSRNVGILTCPPPVNTAPYTSPNTTTLTHGSELRINITKSVIRDKSETVRTLPRTEAELRTVTIAGEEKTATTKPGSTENAAKRGKSTG